ncbi:MAG: Fe-S cluster assembly protein SufD [Armatimonadetes bacterium]|nr:Fe-S cluster assembly protein SufD [Armatimonadota bacterium]
MVDVSTTWRSQFEAQACANAPEWLTSLRADAFARFTELGFPTRRDEEWRFTPVSPITETIFTAATQSVSAEEVALAPFTEIGGTRLVFVNGKYAESLSEVRALPKGAVVVSIAQGFSEHAKTLEAHFGKYVQGENHAFVSLNTAFTQDGALVIIPRNATVEDPIHLLYLTVAGDTPTVSHPRTLILAGENAQVTIAEVYSGIGEGTTFTNAVTEIVLAPNAVVDHYKVQAESASAYHVGVQQVQLDRSGNFTSHNIAIGGALVRNEANAVLGAEGCECTLNGLYIAGTGQLIDNHTAIDHAMPHCNSHELYKGIIKGKGRGVFNGKIFVRKDAQKTDAKQTNQTLLLSKEAQINTKPQLEIFADDVKCTHGATVGQLSEESLFYLQSRGIGLEEATSLLTYAFASEVIGRVKIEALRDQIHSALFLQLPIAIRPEEA